MEDRRIAPGHYADVFRVGQDDQRADHGDPDREHIAVAVVTGVREAERVQPDQSGLDRGWQWRAGGERARHTLAIYIRLSNAGSILPAWGNGRHCSTALGVACWNPGTHVPPPQIWWPPPGPILAPSPIPSPGSVPPPGCGVLPPPAPPPPPTS